MGDTKIMFFFVRTKKIDEINVKLDRVLVGLEDVQTRVKNIEKAENTKKFIRKIKYLNNNHKNLPIAKNGVVG